MTPVLVTGGAGYIGSHTCKALAREGFAPVAFDNLSRGHRDLVKWGQLIEGDLRDTALLREALRWLKPAAVIHFAAFAYVGESVADPALYFDNNVGGTLSLLKAMRDAGCDRLIVSSTCATYGQAEKMPIDETADQRPLNPYGVSKLQMEQMCAAFGAAHGIRSVALRYFNAAGGDLDGETGERHEPEPHLIPRALMAADGEGEGLQIFGNDYPTPDGTCIRDYIHVRDLADAHVRAARHLLDGGASDAFNLGTGRGHSVKEVIAAVAAATGRAVPHTVAPRRAGDPAELVADPRRARRVLGWQAGNSDLRTIVDTAWAWHVKDRETQGARTSSPLAG
jgi:UDP-glucose-4-epimerase GalE